ncbi:MAG: aminotransferase class I/II-fold pyridoxal phosphate-dependent enzyme, partial [Phaeodactylibacter sp.]|nr:aminotransferase class I/II-fold pyridoxal phosphate-dependent enzyme [Phaeodactylibacter sp.]
MTGWRLGYMGGPTQIAAACAKIQGQFTSGATAFGQKAAAYALESDLGPTYAMVDEFHKRKDIVVQLLTAIPGFQVNDPEGAFYVFPDISDFFGKSYDGQLIENSEDFCAFLMSEALVGTVPGSAFGLEGCIRLSYAASEEVLREAIERIATAVGKLN